MTYLDNTRDSLGSKAPATAFVPDNENEISVNWEKYSTALETRNQTKQGDPKDQAIAKLLVGLIRKIDLGRVSGEFVDPAHLEADHDPDEDNQAHSNIIHFPKFIGVLMRKKKRTRIRLELSLISEIVLN